MLMLKLGVVAHSCNPATQGGRDLDCGSRIAWGKKFERPHLSLNWMWCYTPVFPATGKVEVEESQSRLV
jgi:hypothetical protein